MLDNSILRDYYKILHRDLVNLGEHYDVYREEIGDGDRAMEMGIAHTMRNRLLYSARHDREVFNLIWKRPEIVDLMKQCRTTHGIETPNLIIQFVGKESWLAVTCDELIKNNDLYVENLQEERRAIKDMLNTTFHDGYSAFVAFMSRQNASEAEKRTRERISVLQGELYDCIYNIYYWLSRSADEKEKWIEKAELNEGEAIEAHQLSYSDRKWYCAHANGVEEAVSTMLRENDTPAKSAIEEIWEESTHKAIVGSITIPKSFRGAVRATWVDYLINTTVASVIGAVGKTLLKHDYTQKQKGEKGALLPTTIAGSLELYNKYTTLCENGIEE